MCSWWKAGSMIRREAAVELAVDRQQAVAHQSDQVAEVAFAPLEVRRVRRP